MDNVDISTKHQRLVNKTNDFNVKTDISLPQWTIIPTLCAQFGMPWSSLGIWGMQLGLDHRIWLG